MNENKISVRYAKALFGLVKETNTSAILKEDIELLLQCIRQVPELQFLIESPVIPVSEKTRLFGESFRGSVSDLAFSFINLVLKHRREEYLAGMCRNVLDLIKADEGILSAELITAVPVSENLRQSIIRLITRKFKKQITLVEKLDGSIVGGYILRVEDQQIDASISTKLNLIKSQLINSPS